MKSFFTRVFLFLGLALGGFHCIQEKANKQMNLKWFEAGVTPAFEGKQLGYAGSAAGISKEHLLVIGGANFPEKASWNGGKKRYYQLINVYQKSTEGTLQCLKTFQTEKNLAYAAHCTTPSGLVIAGGENENGIQKEVMQYIWENDSLRIEKLADLPIPVTNAQMAYVNGKVYFAGGENTQQTLDVFWVLDLNKGKEWHSVAHLPQATSNAVLLAHQNELFLVGGRQKHTQTPTTFFKEVYAYQINENQWVKKADLPYTLAAHQGVVTNGQLLVFSGDKGETFNKTEALIFKINQCTDANEKQKLVEEKALLQENHPGFTNKLLAYDFQKNTWSVKDTIPFPGQVTMAVVSWGDNIYLVNGEIRAGVRTPKIVGYQIDKE